MILSWGLFTVKGEPHLFYTSKYMSTGVLKLLFFGSRWAELPEKMMSLELKTTSESILMNLDVWSYRGVSSAAASLTGLNLYPECSSCIVGNVGTTKVEWKITISPDLLHDFQWKFVSFKQHNWTSVSFLGAFKVQCTMTTQHVFTVRVAPGEKSLKLCHTSCFYVVICWIQETI